ncbi:MAG: AAA family ATPase [Sulfuricurvum sp.]|uniref:AAA family ATPase n=1 Tax=Sulfuricurvum sp. TaxID=2025608 RepID=UPI00261A0568|nr:AAA family ATPase [Sulfuricurvum sp.]MDD2368608.1 AAA family ATPase [Sulfuricurvum sp.]MDD2950522.1 AAA family ATPase [Sulfuricurvum sp.]MDD5119176.1 AAA family ATPase [Sulfuricurvum sp.]
MELVYLWVEEYKNIKNQGFNFSPKFECNYDGEKLTICDKKKKKCKNNDYIEHFFGENIKLTAVVGENGSGKTSVIKFIFMLIFYNNFKNFNKNDYDKSDEYQQFRAAETLKYKNAEANNQYKGFLILFNGSDFYKASMLIDVFSNNMSRIGILAFLNGQQIDLSSIEPENIDFYSIHFNYMLDTLKDGNHDEFIDTIYHKSDGYETSLLLEPYKRVNNKEQIDINNLEYLSQQKFANIFRRGIKNQFIEKFFNPNLVRISINIQKVLNKIDKLSANVVGNSLIDNENPITVSNKNNLFIHTNPYDVKSKVTALYTDKDYDNLNKIYIALKILEKNYHRKFKKIYSAFFESKNSQETINNTIEEVGKIQSVLIDFLKEEKILNFEMQKLINSVNFESQILNTEDRKIFDKYLNRKVDIKLLSNLLTNIAPWVDIEYFEDDKSYKSLSSGEKTLFSFMINLMYQVDNLKDTKYKQINLFLDETELGLHPQWQKQYLKYIIMTLKDFDINIHIIFITHSPFILSDIPKENVIFLDKFDEKTKEKYPKLNIDGLKNGNCINVSDHIDINPFGSNIHTLFSHGFFMEDGLMGEFAKEKINDVYDFLSNPNTQINLTQIKAQNIINLIGEQILKKELQILYDDRFETSDIDKQIREHQEAIKRLKAQSKK